MTNQFERVFRGRKLTAEEIARNEEVRRRVREEFPPVRRTTGNGNESLTDVLRQAIRASERSLQDIANDVNVSLKYLSSFLQANVIFVWQPRTNWPGF